jgi:hypothetical protein
MTIKQFFEERTERLGISIQPSPNDLGGGGGDGGNNNNRKNSKGGGDKRNVKPPTEEVMIRYIIDHPNETTESVIEHFDFRMWKRRWFPERFKTWEIADGKIYLPDFWEEIEESTLNNHDKVWRDNDRLRRQQIGLKISKLEQNPKTGDWKFELTDTQTGKVIPTSEAIERIDKADAEEDERVRQLWGRYNPVYE